MRIKAEDCETIARPARRRCAFFEEVKALDINLRRMFREGPRRAVASTKVEAWRRGHRRLSERSSAEKGPPVSPSMMSEIEGAERTPSVHRPTQCSGTGTCA